MDAGLIARSALGFLFLHALAWVLSENRRTVAWRPVVAGMLLTLALGVLLLKAPLIRDAFMALNDALAALERATREGTAFVFGFLGGGPLPYSESYPGATFVLAFRALPLVVVVSAFSALLFYWRVLPWIVKGFALMLEKTMGVGGAIGLSSAANVFVGMVEAPLVVKPYIRDMSRSELFILMSCGMATVAGTVMALYASILSKVIPDALGHILVASIISTPAAIAISVLMVPGEAALVVGAVAGDFLGAGAEAGGGGTDAEDEIIAAVGGAFEGADVIHEALGAGDGGRFFDEIGEFHFNVGFGGVELGLDFVEDGDDEGGGDGLVVVVEDFEEAGHVRAFFVLGQRHVEADGGDGDLFAATGLPEGDGVVNALDADLVDGDVATVGGALDIGHGGVGNLGVGFGHQ